ncbi:unnamed protein product, partial [Effrenium voratum]
MPSACPGLDGEPCAFSTTRPGAAAQKRPGHAACASWPLKGFSRSLANSNDPPFARAEAFCSPHELADACLQAARRAQLKRCLLALAPDLQQLALERIPEDFRARFRGALVDPKTCRGMDGERCIFAQRGGPAQMHRRGERCLFCAPEDLWPLCYEEPGRSQVLARLRNMPLASRDKALGERLLPEHAAWFAEQLAAARRPAGPPAVRRRQASSTVPRAEVAARWQRILAARQPLGTVVSAAEKKFYREKVLADRARARRRMGQPQPRTLRGAPVANDSGLPPAKRSKRAEGFERWCLSHSWAACEKCGLMLPRDLTEATLSKDQKAGVAAGRCWRCRGARDLPTLALEDVPEKLRGLSESAMLALSPLEVDVGPVIRAEHGSGYRQHSTMMRLRWSAVSVKEQIKALPEQDDRHRARQAARFLKRSDRTPYKRFCADHETFLAENPEADQLQRRRRLQFIEEIGVECALWPCLLWDVEHTFTQERASDPRRVAREEQVTLEEALRPLAGRCSLEASDGEEDLEPEGLGVARHSVKRLFSAL